MTNEKQEDPAIAEEIKRVEETLAYHMNALLRECHGVVDIGVVLTWGEKYKSESHPSSAIFTNRPIKSITPDQVVELSAPILSLLNQCYAHANMYIAKAYKSVIQDRLALEKESGTGGNIDEKGSSRGPEETNNGDVE